jgi:hypothetical protein
MSPQVRHIEKQVFTIAASLRWRKDENIGIPLGDMYGGFIMSKIFVDIAALAISV